MNDYKEERRQARWNERVLREAVKVEACRAGFADPVEAMAFADLDGIGVQGRLVDAAEVRRRLDRLAADQPHMITGAAGERPAEGLRDVLADASNGELGQLLHGR